MARDRAEEQEISTIPRRTPQPPYNEEIGVIAISAAPFRRPIGGISEILPGGYDVTWQYTAEPWASLSSSSTAAHTTVVPQGTNFWIFVPYYVLWSNKPILQTAYTIAVTVSDGQNADFTNGRVGISTNGVLSGTMDIQCVMPARASVTLKITPWFNPGDQWTPSNYPPKPWF